MSTQLLNDRDIEFQLYEVLDTESLLLRERYREHSREVFNATLETAHTVAQRYFADHNAKGDANEPSFDGEQVHLVPETKVAWDAFAEAGFLAAHHDFEEGGMQLPEVVLRTCMAYFDAANLGSAGYGILTIGAANLIKTFASDTLKNQFLPPMLDGRFAGTMAMTEPGQGSALGDIMTYAEAQEDGSYRLFGQKMFISGGDQSLTENIVHLVLAKIKGAPAGARGISLFLVPKVQVNEDGSLGERNDVALAGLLHKMGWRNTTSTVLSFGEKEGAIGYLIGEPHQGLSYMFQMMNEARIFVGLAASVLAYQGYTYSLNYARERPQGRLPSNRDPESPQVPIIEHADVRRMLLMQKCYAEGSLSICLYASSLFEDQHTAPAAEQRERAALLLDLLTPVVKTFPSKYGCKSNDLAIQVLGGSGYIREYPVEQYYRDQRLNPIHEGTDAMHGLDILGRKVPMKSQAAYNIFREEVALTLQQAGEFDQTRGFVAALEQALGTLDEVTQSLLTNIEQDIDSGFANATVYLDVFCRVVASWIWLKQAVKAAAGLNQDACHPSDQDFYHGKLQAARFYIEWELPEIGPQAALLMENNPVPFEMQDRWF